MITRDMTIDSIFSTHPHKAQALAHVITKAGLHCVGCQASTWETLEAGMMGHGINDAEIDGLVAELNAVLEEEDSDPDTITLTPRAAQKYREILAAEGKEGWGIRFEEHAAGCSGFEYVLDYSEKATEEDVTFISQSIEIHVPDVFVDRLIGSEIDFVDALQGGGFKVTNPNVRSSCGCGTSHGY